MVMLRVYKGVQRRDEYMVAVAVAETVMVVMMEEILQMVKRSKS